MSTAETLGQQPTLRAPNDVMVRYPLENGYRHSTWIVECGEHTANNLEMPLYVQGVFDVAVVTVKGVALTAAQMDSVRAQALKNKIELRKVVGN